jgi:hypothetical protein
MLGWHRFSMHQPVWFFGLTMTEWSEVGTSPLSRALATISRDGLPRVPWILMGSDRIIRLKHIASLLARRHIMGARHQKALVIRWKGQAQ